MSSVPDRPDPSNDPLVRRRVQRALDQVLFAAQDILTRYSRDGLYTPPDPVPFGDVTGLIEAGRNQVVNSLQARLDEARSVMFEVYREVDEYKKELHGPNYRPPTRDISGDVSYER